MKAIVSNLSYAIVAVMLTFAVVNAHDGHNNATLALLIGSILILAVKLPE